jgi:hypothetical protein
MDDIKIFLENLSCKELPFVMKEIGGSVGIELARQSPRFETLGYYISRKKRFTFVRSDPSCF